MLQLPKHPFSKLGKKIESQMRKALYEYEMIPSNGRIGIALSGGKDSLTLLFMLKELSGKGFPDLQIEAFHVGGAFSCGASLEENFLKEVCSALQIPLHIEIAEQTLDKLECYRCSRERRKKIFLKAKSVGIDHVAFGHHRDDSIETLMMNLLHKAEFAANLPKIYLESFDLTILRPLIYVTEQQIISFAKHHGFRRIVCQCPVGQNSKRKETKEMLNQIEQYFPCAKGNLAKAAKMYGSNKASKR